MCTIAHGARGIVAVDASHVVVEVVVVRSLMVVPAGTAMVVMMVVMIWMIPVGGVPAPMIAVPVVGAVPVIVIVPRVVPAVIVVVVIIGAVRIESPVPAIANIDIGVAAAIGIAGIVVVVVVQSGTGTGAEALDAGCEVGIIISLGGGIYHAVGVGHGLGGLIDRLCAGNVVFAIRVICLIVVGGTTRGWRHGATVAACLSITAVVRRVVGVVVSHSLV